jgi:hypothetical protein
VNTYPVVYTILSALLGLAIHVAMSWGEWRKLVHVNCTLLEYVREDKPGFLTACLLSVASYIVLPELGKIAFLQTYLGFTPAVTPMSALVSSFVSSTVGYQVRSYFIKRTTLP